MNTEGKNCFQCDGNCFMVLCALLVVITIFAVWHLVMYAKYKDVIDAMLLQNGENMCGGADQMCVCSGNETMVGAVDPRDMHNAYNLSKVAMGY